MDELEERYASLISDGDLIALQHLIAEIGDFEGVGHRMISHAALLGRPEILAWLLSKGADPNQADPFEDGRFALYWAASGKCLETVKLLVEAGAKVTDNGERDDSQNALHAAAEDGKADFLALLLKAPLAKEGLEVFDYIDRTPLACAVDSGSVDCVRLLLEAGADINALVQITHDDRIGDPPIRRATRNGKVEMTRFLLAHGADPDRPGWMWCSARTDAYNSCTPGTEQIRELLELSPLKKLKDSKNLAEVESQLLADLAHHGVRAQSLSWRGSVAIGETEQVRGHRIAPFSRVRIIDTDGRQIGRGEFHFLVLTVEIEFRVFWTRIETEKGCLTPGNGAIPRHVWEALTPEQRSWIIMDCRNSGWRSPNSGALRVEGHPGAQVEL